MPGIRNNYELILQREVPFTFRYLYSFHMATLRKHLVSLFSDRWPRRGRSYGIVLWAVNRFHIVLRTLLRIFSVPTMRVAR